MSSSHRDPRLYGGRESQYRDPRLYGGRESQYKDPRLYGGRVVPNEARAYKAARQTHRPREATQCNIGTCKFTRWHGPGDGTDKRRQGPVVSSS